MAPPLRVALNLPHCPREANDLDVTCPGAAKLRRARGPGRPGRVDVVDQRNARRRLVDRCEGAPDIRTALCPGQARLPTTRHARPGEERCDRQLPEDAERLCET